MVTERAEKHFSSIASSPIAPQLSIPLHWKDYHHNFWPRRVGVVVAGSYNVGMSESEFEREWNQKLCGKWNL